ncbi:unnamed protein product [Lactuca saligna]|uniref:Uncharacterized protein n=1 Tax=Lactuca saligna TaxID=75948 RepID=A0AA35V531_LACSI|nr:unnamed protein product [Lactuca saligna]
MLLDSLDKRSTSNLLLIGLCFCHRHFPSPHIPNSATIFPNLPLLLCIVCFCPSLPSSPLLLTTVSTINNQHIYTSIHSSWFGFYGFDYLGKLSSSGQISTLDGQRLAVVSGAPPASQTPQPYAFLIKTLSLAPFYPQFGTLLISFRHLLLSKVTLVASPPLKRKPPSDAKAVVVAIPAQLFATFLPLLCRRYFPRTMCSSAVGVSARV